MVLLAAVLAIVSFLPEGSFLLAEGVDAGRPYRIAVGALLVVGAAAICAALFVQVKSLVRRSRATAVPRVSGREPQVDAECIVAALSARGWRAERRPDSGALVFTRHRWSRWAGVVLHVGLLMVMLGMSVVLLTESRDEFTLREGDVLDASAQPSVRVRAPLAPDVELRGALVLDRVVPEYWPSGELRSLDSEFTDATSGQALRVSVNAVTSWSGARLFQNRVYGRVLDVRIVGPYLPEAVYRIEIESIPILGAPAYRDLEIPGIPGQVRIRSIENETSAGAVPEVTVRLEQDGVVTGQGTLPSASSVRISDYDVTLEGYSYWQTIVLVRQYGAEPLMLGTLIVMLSSLVLYLLPPVTIYVLADGGDHRLLVSGSRLAKAAYRLEVESLLKECG